MLGEKLSCDKNCGAVHLRVAGTYLRYAFLQAAGPSVGSSIGNAQEPLQGAKHWRGYQWGTHENSPWVAAGPTGARRRRQATSTALKWDKPEDCGPEQEAAAYNNSRPNFGAAAESQPQEAVRLRILLLSAAFVWLPASVRSSLRITQQNLVILVDNFRYVQSEPRPPAGSLTRPAALSACIVLLPRTGSQPRAGERSGFQLLSFADKPGRRRVAARAQEEDRPPWPDAEEPGQAWHSGGWFSVPLTLCYSIDNSSGQVRANFHSSMKMYSCQYILSL